MPRRAEQSGRRPKAVQALHSRFRSSSRFLQCLGRCERDASERTPQYRDLLTNSKSYDRLDFQDALQWVWDMAPKEFCPTLGVQPTCEDDSDLLPT
jgi:hypothetical protein